MRFAHAHKVTSYAMALCAYMALVLSGELSDVPVVASALAIPVSWFWETPRVRVERFSRAWTGLSAAVFAYSVLAALAGTDILLTGAHFLIYLTVNKLFNRRTCKDYQQLYILSFLMLVAATVLNSQFSFAIFFIGFVVTSTWAIILFHLRREMEDNFLLKHSDDRASERVQVDRILNSRRIVGRSFFVGTSMVSITIFLAATLLFLLIPRIGFGLFFQKSRPSVTMTGFSDGVQLGSHGVIKNDSTVVMRIQVDDTYEGRNAPYVHWRGVAFDLYENGQWRRSRSAPLTHRKVIEPEPNVTRHYLLYTARGLADEVLEQRLERSVRQEIYLEPTGYDVLFGASMPLAFEFESSLTRPRKERNDEIRHPHGAGIKYVVYSNLEEPSPETLRKAIDVLPVDFGVYLEIPSEVPERVIDLAKDITKDAETTYDKVKAIEQWLKNNLQYTLRMESPGDREPVDFFLFERKMGHCEYFSSAMAIMVRAIGVPSRNVNGFLGGEWNEYNNYIMVRAGDAHSWVEVYFHDTGWVTFDPTPSASIDQLGRGGEGVMDRLRRLADTARFKWFKWVIEYDLYRQMSLFRNLGNGLRRSAGGLFRGGPSQLKAWAARNKKTAIVLGAIVVAVLLVASLWVRRRREIEETLGWNRRRRRKRSPVAAIYAAVLAKLARHGHRRAPATTPREHARALSARGVPGAAEISELTELYYRVEYGNEIPDGAAQRARELRIAIEDALKGAKQGHSQAS